MQARKPSTVLPVTLILLKTFISCAIILNIEIDRGDIIMNELAKYWDKIHLQYNSNYDNWLNKYVHLFNQDDSIIELGCGRAYCSNYLLENGFKDITACDFSEEVLKIVNISNPTLKTKLFDMSIELPFKDKSINLIVADLSLHYFNSSTTKYIFDEIHRILKDTGYLIARVNSANDKFHIPNNAQELEKNFFYDGNIYKKFFEKSDFDALFKNFEVHNIEEKCMDRYQKPKILWEFCIKKCNGG